MIFGMPTLIERVHLEQNLKLCNELGLSFVELNMNMPQYQLEKLEEAEPLKSLADKYKIFYTIHLDENLNVCDFNHIVAKAYQETVQRTIEAAKKLQAPVLNIHLHHGIQFTLPGRKIMLYDKYKDEYLDAITQFRNLCETAIGKDSIKICIENTDGFRPYEVEAIKLLLQSKVFALTWDVGHSRVSGNVDEQFLLEWEEKLGHFHLHDANELEDHLALGTGDVDLQQKLVIAEKRRCRCVIETKTVSSLRQSVDWLKSNGQFASFVRQ